MQDSPPDIPLEHEIGRLLMLVMQDFHQRLGADLQQRGIDGIPARQRAVFLHLDRFGPSRSVDLAEAAGIRPQSMMATINELEQAKMVVRRPDPSDSRAKLIDFTSKGKQFIEQLTQSTASVWDQYAQLTGQRQLTETFSGLKALQAALSAARDTP
ncbi:MAG: MarR family winged helix-turn-helix transcriptional regulator [Pseudomonadales bacterium]